MVETQFSFLNWNHLSLKQREIIINALLAVAQNALFNMFAYLLSNHVSSRMIRDQQGAKPNKSDKSTCDEISLLNTFLLSYVFTSCITPIIKSVMR